MDMAFFLMALFMALRPSEYTLDGNHQTGFMLARCHQRVDRLRPENL